MNYQFIGYHFTTVQSIAVAGVVVVLVLVPVGAFIQRRRARTLALHSRLGSEYDCAILQFGSAHEAEADPAGPGTHCEALKIRELGATERARFVAEWDTVQSRFADHPMTALIEADDLIDAVLEARGYPQAGFERRAAEVSVDYPGTMENYRAAHSIAIHLGQVASADEELRTAMIRYRAIFDELLRAPKRLEAELPHGSRLAGLPILAPYSGARMR